VTRSFAASSRGCDDLAFEPPQDTEGRIIATMRITGDEDASVIARRILDLYREQLNRRVGS
jgi:hypothetical protein